MPFCTDRKVLHVQSISEWAPSCIGPYSQAVSTAGLLYFAGQIGLKPATMQLFPSLQDQVDQCFSSCQVGRSSSLACEQTFLPKGLTGEFVAFRRQVSVVLLRKDLVLLLW